MNNRFHLQDINPLAGLTETSLVGLLMQGERGAYAQLQWLFRYIEKRNPSARAVKRRLLSALGSLQWSIKMEDVGDDAEKKQRAEKHQAHLQTAYAQISNLKAALRHLALAELRGFAHVEKIYEGAGAEDPWAIVELRPVEQWFWVRDGLRGAWKYNRGARIGTWDGEQIDPAHWIIREIDDPANEIIAKCHVRQETSDADWDGFLEDYGVPPQFIEGPPNVSPDKEREYQAQAELIVSRSRGYLPNGSRLHSPSASGSGGAGIFKERLEYLDGQIVIAGTSGKLTILTEAGSGTLAGGAQETAFAEIAQDIADNVAEAMQAQFDTALLKRAFPGEKPLAFFSYGRADQEDTKQLADDAVKYAQAGYQIDAQELSDRSGYTLTPQSAPTLPIGNQTKQDLPLPGQTPAASPALPTDDALSAAKPSERAASPTAPTRGALDLATADQLGVTPEFLAPAASAIDALLAAAQDGNVSNAELLASAQQMLDSLPDLAAEMDATGIAAALERAMRQAAETALQA